MKLRFRSLLSCGLLIGGLLGATQIASAATSTATLTAGALAISAPATDFSYAGTLNGTVLTLPSSFDVGVNDATGSKAGWNLTASIAVLTIGVTTDTIPAVGHTIQSVTIIPGTGVAPSTVTSYPMQIPTSTSKIFSAAANTGKGQSTESFTTQLLVPAQTAAGAYTAAMTVSIVSGP